MVLLTIVLKRFTKVNILSCTPDQSFAGVVTTYHMQETRSLLNKHTQNGSRVLTIQVILKRLCIARTVI